MKTIGDMLEPFAITEVRPGFNQPDENGQSAFETLTERSFEGKWLVLYFYPKAFTFVCPTEIVAYNKLVPDFEDRDAVLLGGSLDNEFAQLAWRREQKDLDRLKHWQFADVGGILTDQLGIRDRNTRVPLRATFIINPQGEIAHVTVNNLDVGRNAQEALRVLDALQTGELCACNRTVGGATL
ncbi:peroxiredoxin [Nostoc sp. CHAB 5834]|nr:peroxiredoxin [Nostoc sp. CHAB 5834]